MVRIIKAEKTMRKYDQKFLKPVSSVWKWSKYQRVSWKGKSIELDFPGSYIINQHKQYSDENWIRIWRSFHHQFYVFTVCKWLLCLTLWFQCHNILGYCYGINNFKSTRCFWYIAREVNKPWEIPLVYTWKQENPLVLE